MYKLNLSYRPAFMKLTMGNCCTTSPEKLYIHRVSPKDANINPPRPFHVVELWVKWEFPLTIPLPSETGRCSATVEKEWVTVNELKKLIGAQTIHDYRGRELNPNTPVRGLSSLRISFNTVRMRLYFENAPRSSVPGRVRSLGPVSFDNVHDITEFTQRYLSFGSREKSLRIHRQLLLSAFEYTLDHQAHLPKDVVFFNELKQVVTDLRPLYETLPADRATDISIKVPVDPQWTPLLMRATEYLAAASTH